MEFQTSANNNADNNADNNAERQPDKYLDKRSYLSLLAGLGGSTLLFSAVFMLALVAKLLTKGTPNGLYLAGFGAVGYAAWRLTKYAVRTAAALAEPAPSVTPQQQKLRGQVMQLAQAAGGRLSASDVAAGTHLGITESHRLLKALVKQGVAEVWVRDDGGLVYVFPEFFAGFKEGASDPFANADS